MNIGIFFIGFVCCCFVENISSVVENVIVFCLDNLLCIVMCYSDFIFFIGFEKVLYSCEDGILMILLLLCKCKMFLFFL